MTYRSKTIIEDTAQKRGHHVTKNDWWVEHGYSVIRCKLPYGDYCTPPAVVVDTKEDVMELVMDIRRDHRRFRDAAIKAYNAGTHLIILVENEDGITSLRDLAKWQEPESIYEMRKKRNDKAVRYDGKSIAKACRTMYANYGLEFDFCTPEEAGERVLQLLGVII